MFVIVRLFFKKTGWSFDGLFVCVFCLRSRVCLFVCLFVVCLFVCLGACSGC